VLLGSIIEQVTRQPMAAAIRDLAGVDRVGLTHTWFEELEPEPRSAPRRLEQTINGLVVSDIHASADLFGGGGLVSTLEDLAGVYTALVTRAVPLARDRVDLMMTATPQSIAAGSPYGMGLEILAVNNQTCFGHRGFWGTAAYVCPELGITLSGVVADAASAGELHRLLRESIALMGGNDEHAANHSSRELD
jgi:D-alanyl-D-alanine carboxypeptidase